MCISVICIAEKTLYEAFYIHAGVVADPNQLEGVDFQKYTAMIYFNMGLRTTSLFAPLLLSSYISYVLPLCYRLVYVYT